MTVYILLTISGMIAQYYSTVCQLCNFWWWMISLYYFLPFVHIMWHINSVITWMHVFLRQLEFCSIIGDTNYCTYSVEVDQYIV